MRRYTSLSTSSTQRIKLSAVCHGPAALAHLKLPSNEGYLLDGYRVIGFSNVEEEQVGLMAVVPFFRLLEDALNTAPPRRMAGAL